MKRCANAEIENFLFSGTLISLPHAAVSDAAANVNGYNSHQMGKYYCTAGARSYKEKSCLNAGLELSDWPLIFSQPICAFYTGVYRFYKGIFI